MIKYSQKDVSRYEVCLSSLMLKEVSDCPEPKRSALRDYLKQMVYENYDVTKEALDVAHQIVAMGVLTSKGTDDCQYIRTAVTGRCDFFEAYPEYEFI